MIKYTCAVLLFLIIVLHNPVTIDNPIVEGNYIHVDNSVIINNSVNESVELSNRSERVIIVTATAYTHTGNRTATGTWPQAGRTIAADPNVIPLGSVIYIEGFGRRVVEDTGGVIKGNSIDIFMDTEQECFKFGRRKIKIKVLSTTHG